MAQALKYINELLANFPDNTSGIISAENVRDFVVSFVNGRGYLVDETQITLPILDGAWTAINPLLLSPASTSTLWAFDGNNFGVSNYSALADTVVPVGYSKLLNIVVVLDLNKIAGGADSYQAQITRNGVGIGLAESIDFPAAGATTVTLVDASLADVSLTDIYGVQIQGLGTTDSLDLRYFSLSLSDSILLGDPTP